MESSKLHEITIMGRQMFIDGTSINGIRNISVDISPGEVPEVTVGILPNGLDVETMAKLEIKPELTDIYDAVKCIRMYMQLDTEFRKAVTASARSVIEEVRNANRMDVVNDHELAARIIDRIFMGER